MPQVYPALNTGMVNAVYNSPLGAMALQWHTKMKYMSENPLAIGIGATVITKKVFDSLKPEHQAARQAEARDIDERPRHRPPTTENPVMMKGNRFRYSPKNGI